MQILCIGDVVGSHGCDFLRRTLPAFKRTKGIDVVIANGENSSDGNGIAKIDGMVVFVPYTAVGDQLQVRIVKVQKNFAFGIIDKLLQPSPDRVEDRCPV